MNALLRGKGPARVVDILGGHTVLQPVHFRNFGLANRTYVLRDRIGDATSVRYVFDYIGLTRYNPIVLKLDPARLPQ